MIFLYLAGLVLVGIGFVVGQLPLTIVLMQKMQALIQDGNTNVLEANERMMAYDFAFFGLSELYALVLILLSFVGGLAALYFVVQYLHRRPFRTLITSTGKISWNKVAFGCSLWLLMSLLTEGGSILLSPEKYIFTFQWQTFLPLLLICLTLLPLQTSFEELFMRGYLLQGIPIHPNTLLSSLIIGGGSIHLITLTQQASEQVGQYAIGYVVGGLLLFGLLLLERMGVMNIGLYQLFRTPIIPLLITSAFFGLLHGMNPEVAEFGLGKMMVFYIGTGLFLGLLTILDEGLELALGVHFANNLFSALFVSFEGSALQTPSLFKSLEVDVDAMLLPWLLGLLVFLGICQWKYKWTDWGKVFRSIQFSMEASQKPHDLAMLGQHSRKEEAPDS